MGRLMLAGGSLCSACLAVIGQSGRTPHESLIGRNVSFFTEIARIANRMRRGSGFTLIQASGGL
ncbi:exported hypothetical protein [Candidatus Sulfopaludibacter sp. SbA3]|nr:exported hypothetical protein [Candidatus Sulfopaludibacter sp. SbA3]